MKQLTRVDARTISALQKEVKIHQMVSKNQNIVQFYGYSGHRIVTELMEGGDLRTALTTDGDSFAWDKRGYGVALGIARGVSFLHESGVIHRCDLLNAMCAAFTQLPRHMACSLCRSSDSYFLRCIMSSCLQCASCAAMHLCKKVIREREP